MTMQVSMEPQLEASPNPGPTPSVYWMFRGPSAYVALTPWRPWPGGLAALGIFLGAVAAVALVLLSAWGLQASVEDVFVAITGTLVQQIAMIALTVFAASRYGGSPSTVMALRPPAQGLRAYPISFLMLVALTLAMSAIFQLLDAQSFKADIKVYQEMMTSKWWWLALILVGIGAPISEELLCRGFLFSAIANSRLGTTGAAIITSLGFAVVHPYSVIGVIQVFAIGMLFSWILIRTGSLRVTIVCHAVYNCVLALMLMSAASTPPP